MKPFWHPTSTTLIRDPPCFATSTLLRMLLSDSGPLDLIYAGDRMWPSVEHGSTFQAVLPNPERLGTGSCVVALVGGIPELLRIDGISGDSFTLAGDADPGTVVEVGVDAIVAAALLPKARSGPLTRNLRRLMLDLSEAWSGRPDPSQDPAATVLDKYESQAVFYSRTEGPGIEPGLLRTIADQVPASTGILVIGSGAGKECLALAEAGWDVIGVDFSSSMVELATEAASQRGLNVRFEAADIRDYEPPPARLGGVVFTYDVYSFLPRSADRVALLSRIRRWLGSDGRLLLSARRASSWYTRMILSLQWLARGSTAGSEWGDSHTRWIASDGSLRRSYVRVFQPSQLNEEARTAGLQLGPWDGGHCVVEPVRAAIMRNR